jgi:hypothetical protein
MDQLVIYHMLCRSALASLLLLVALIGFTQAQYTTNGTNFHVTHNAAYCFYYSTGDLDVSNTNTWLNATSNNLFAYAGIFLSPTLSLTPSTIQLAVCCPNDHTGDTCDTTSANSFSYQNSGATQYVLACLECNYWLGDCIFDLFNLNLGQQFEQGYVQCSFCH